jgi:hypothetical protein
VGSPAIDAGRNSDVPAGITTDAEGLARFINASNGQPGIVDIGAYEMPAGTTGIKNLLADTDWTVYPNPVAEKITVAWSKPCANAQLNVMNTLGHFISSTTVRQGETEFELNMSNLPAGSYFIHLLMDGGQDVKKVVVQ